MSDHSKDRRSTVPMIDHSWRTFWLNKLKVLAVAAALVLIWYLMSDSPLNFFAWSREYMISGLLMTRWFLIIALTVIAMYIVV